MSFHSILNINRLSKSLFQYNYVNSDYDLQQIQFDLGCIVGRRILNPLFYEGPLHCLPLFFKFCQNPAPPPCHLQSLTLLLILLSCFFDWMDHCATFDVLFYLMISYQWMCISGALGPWYVFYATRHQVYWGLTHDLAFC